MNKLARRSVLLHSSTFNVHPSPTLKSKSKSTFFQTCIVYQLNAPSSKSAIMISISLENPVCSSINVSATLVPSIAIDDESLQGISGRLTLESA
jgi:hypothetical protein